MPRILNSADIAAAGGSLESELAAVAKTGAYGDLLGAPVFGGAATKARKILRAAARNVTIGAVMATPPTYMAGASNINSTVVASATTAYLGATILPSDPRLEWVSGSWQLSTNQWTGAGQTGLNGTGLRGTQGHGFRFATYAPDVDCAINGTKHIVYVTDVLTGVRARVAADDAAAVASTAYHKYSFASARLRIWEWYFPTTAIVRGFNVTPGHSIWRAPSVDEPRIAVMGDSYWDATVSQATASTINVRQNVSHYFGAALGATNILSLGSGGTGFINSSNADFVTRLQAGDLSVARHGDLDLVGIPCSVNDDVGVNAAFTDSAVAAEVTAAFTILKAAQPNAIIFGCGPEVTINRPSNQGRFDAMQAAFLAVANGDPRMLWLDNSPAGENWLSNASPGPNINAVVIGTDNTHLTDGGQPYFAERIAASLKAKLTLLAA